MCACMRVLVENILAFIPDHYAFVCEVRISCVPVSVFLDRALVQVGVCGRFGVDATAPLCVSSLSRRTKVSERNESLISD